MHPLYQQFQATLLGRLKAKEQIRLSGSEERLPSQKAFFREVLARWKTNPAEGRFYFNLLDCTVVNPVEFPDSFSRRDVLSLLADLNRAEYFDRIYAEGRLRGEAGLPQKGCLILGHIRENGDPVYHAAIFSEGDIDHCSFCRLVPKGVDGDGEIAILTDEGWSKLSPRKATTCSPARVMLAALRSHVERIGPRYVPTAELKEDPADEPPHDAELMRRLTAVIKGTMPVTTATVALTSISPHSIDFCFHFSPDRIRPTTNRIHRGYRPQMAVYWNGSSFIMSDDYLAYLAYQQAEHEQVPVAILGEFPAEIANVHNVGGHELLPPLGIEGGGRYPAPPTEEFKSWRLKARLQSAKRKDLPGDLIAVWMAFAELLSFDDLSEKQLHAFIMRYPEVLTVYGTEMTSEVRLEDAYRIDVVVRARGVQDEVTLVELEHHHHIIFTRDGQTRSEITHAIQQVQDWFRWIRENPTDDFSLSLGRLPPKGLVVAGRSRAFQDGDRDRLAHLNATAAVPLITYDELLDRFGDIIINQRDDSED